VKSANIAHAADLVEKHKLRAYDAIQLAVAIELFGDYQTQGIQITFVSADNELLTAANAESLQIENPTNYP
jgi:uncharacterized protein